MEAIHLPADDFILVGGAVVVLGVFTAGLAERARVPGLLIFMFLGMAIADDGLELVRFDDAELSQSIAIVALVMILFDGGLSVSLSEVRRIVAPALVLATVALILTAAIVAVIAVVLLDVPGTTAWLLGAVVACTDAAAVLAVLRDVQVPNRLRMVLEAESGMNDPVAVALTIGVLETWQHGGDPVEWVLFVLLQLGGGAVIGIGMGRLGGWTSNRAHLHGVALHAVLGSGVAGLAYGVAAAIGASGLLAVYLAGLVLGSTAPRHRHALRTVHQGFAATGEIVLFLLLGLLVFPSDLGSVAADGTAIAVVLALIARPVAVFATLTWFGFRVNELVLIAWAGLRGAVPIVLATFPLTAGHPDGQLIFNLVFFVVLVSVAVQGPTIAPLAGRLGLKGERRAATVDVIPLDTVAADVVEMELEESATVVGRPLREVPMPAGMRVSVLVRSDRTVVPDGETVLEAGDLLVVVADAKLSAESLLGEWAEGRAGR